MLFYSKGADFSPLLAIFLTFFKIHLAFHFSALVSIRLLFMQLCLFFTMHCILSWEVSALLVLPYIEKATNERGQSVGTLWGFSLQSKVLLQQFFCRQKLSRNSSILKGLPFVAVLHTEAIHHFWFKKSKFWKSIANSALSSGYLHS